MGSQTFKSTLITQSKLGMFHASAIVLVLIWTLSPLGSQSSLQILHLQERQDNMTNYTVSYFDASAKPGFATPNFKADVSLNALFSSILMVNSPSDPKNILISTEDPFYNLIIPDLAGLIQLYDVKYGTVEFKPNSTGCEFNNLYFPLQICHVLLQ